MTLQQNTLRALAPALMLLLSACGGNAGRDAAQSAALQPAPAPAASQVAQRGLAQLDKALTFEQANEFLRRNQSALQPQVQWQPLPTAVGTVLPPLTIDTQNREAVRSFYNGLYFQANGVAMNWTGSYKGCNAGTISSAYQDATAARVNWVRAMAGVPANIVFDAGNNAKSQQAAYMMSVNGQLSHNPPGSWTCYTADGATAAGNSNLAIGNAGPDAISNGYLGDSGSNNAEVGHRRWLLYPQTQIMGSGSVPGVAGDPNTGAGFIYSANALWVFDNNFGSTRPSVRDDFIAWPPQGYVPYPLVYGRWSFSYKNADFSKARVTVSKGGVNIPVTLEQLTNGYGENTIVWLLQGTNDTSVAAKPVADTAYSVTISNVLLSGSVLSFNYNVIVFDPAIATPGAAAATVTSIVSTANSVNITPNVPAAVQLTAMPNATGYGVNFYRHTAFNTLLTAQNAAGNWTSNTSPSYNPIGSTSFNLFHADAGAQSVTYNGKLLMGTTASVEFDKSVGYAGTGEYLKLQVSSDNGVTWNDAFTDVGTGSPQSSTHISIDLSQYAGKALIFRFALAYDYGTSYYFTPGQSGWQFNNILFHQADLLQDEQIIFLPNGQTGTSAAFATVGDYIAIARTQYQGRYFSDWGNPFFFSVSATGGGTGGSGGNGSAAFPFTGNLANYTITKTTGGYLVTDNVGNGGAQLVANTSRIAFKDVTIAFDIDGIAGQAYRIYQAAFGRVPDQAGLGYWIKQMDNGSSLTNVAASFMVSTEFKNLYGTSPSVDTFLTTLYKNILGRVPDQAGYDYWKNQILAGQITQPGVLASFTESAENKAKTSAATQNGIVYVVWAF